MVCYKFEYIHLQLEQVTVVKKKSLYSFKYRSNEWKMKMPALHTSITYSYSVSKYSLTSDHFLFKI